MTGQANLSGSARLLEVKNVVCEHGVIQGDAPGSEQRDEAPQVMAQLGDGRRGDQGVEARPGRRVLVVRWTDQAAGGMAEPSSGHEHGFGP